MHVDIPSLKDFKALNTERADACISLYLPTTPLTQDIEAARITFGNLVKSALEELTAAGFDKRRLALLSESLDDLADDDEFWAHQANSLAVLATPDRLRTFRLANRLTELVEVADRFHLKPLLRALTFRQHAYVLAISENGVRLVEVTPDLPAVEVKISGLPKDAASFAGMATINDRSAKRRLTGSEGQKVRLRQYARAVDAAIRPLLSAHNNVPLIIAATEPLASIYRTISSAPDLIPDTITATNDRSSDAELAEAARPVLDAAYAREIEVLHRLYEQRAATGRVTSDISDAARAATFGAIETLIVDIDEIVHGTIDDETGAVTFADAPGPASYGVVNEIAARALASGARVMGARTADIPGGKSLAAILRYPI